MAFPAWGATAPKDSDKPLRFMPYRLADSHGLYRTPMKRQPGRVPVKASTEGRPEIIGNCTSSKVGHGMYSYYAESSTSPNKLAETPAFFGSGVYVNGKYYGCDYDYDADHNLKYIRWYVYDAHTWYCEKMVENPLDYTYIATDRTYDPSSGTVYSIVYDKTASAIWLATTALADGASTLIAPLQKNVITIASSASGQLYGIDTEANLYTISKSDAALTLVGNTKIYDDYLSDYTQSICMDHATGKIYWSEFHTEGLFSSVSALYEVNPSNAATVKISDLPGNPEMVGTYVADYAVPGVPQAPADLRATPDAAGGLSYTFAFTAPTRTSDGKSLGAGNLTFEVSVDGELIDIVEAAPGAAVTSGPHSIVRGIHTLKITAENAVGVSEPGALMFFAGYDVPAAPSYIALFVNGDNLSLTWGAPEIGAQGGVIRSPLTYDVVRNPGNVKVASGISATSWSETVSSAARYSYEVTAISPDGRGGTATTRSVVAGAMSVPYSCGFDTEDEFLLYTIVDVTSNGQVWNYDADNRRMRHPWSMYNPTDDYAVSPGIRMDGAKSYTISFDAWQMVGTYSEHVQLWFGPSPDVSQMRMVLDTQTLPEQAKRFEAVVAPSGDGVYYFAFRSNAPKQGFMSYVDNVSVMEKGASGVASQVTDLTAKGAPNGRTAVDISFTAPTTALNGSALTSISRIEVTRQGADHTVSTITAAQPGKRYELTDAEVGTGLYTYTVTAYTEAGAGIPATVKAFAGVDVPKAPVNVAMSGKPGNILITWEAPTEGEQGGNLEGVLSYRVERVVNEVPELVAENLEATEYADSWTTDRQAFVYYYVTAVTPVGISESVATESYAAGDAYELPFHESFAGGNAENAPWSVEQVQGMQGSWTIKAKGEDPYCSPQDADGGLATFDGYHSWTKDCELRLISPEINISAFDDPKLTFHLYHWNGETWGGDNDPVEETLRVEVSCDRAPFTAVPDATYNLYRAKKGWQDYTLDLSPYVGCGSARVAFRGKGAGCFNIHIDNISITGNKPSGVNEITAAAAANVTSGPGEIIFRGVRTGIEVYDTAGRKAAASHAAAGVFRVTPGLYLVSADGTTVKILVK